MDAATAKAFVQYVVDQRNGVDYAYIAAYAVLFYDWLLTLDAEFQLIWRADWNYTKILFILSRYLPMINVIFILRNQLGLDVDWTMCGRFFRTSSWLLVLGLTFAETILSVRTWAVWRRNRYVGFLLVGLQLGSFIVDSVFAERFLNSLALAPAPYPGFRGCFLTGASNIIYINFILLTVVDIIVLTLMGISAWKFYRRGNFSELSLVVHRDGILFYAYLLLFTIGNFVIMLVAPPSFQIMLTPLQASFYSMFCCRIILNIRSAGTGTSNELLTTQLHTIRAEDPQVILPLDFRSPVATFESMGRQSRRPLY